MINRKPPKPKLPKPRPEAIFWQPGQQPPKPDFSMVPHSTGENVQANFRCDHVTAADLEEHMRRLERKAAGFSITLTDVIRSLIQEGARSYREQFRDEETPQPDDEATDE
jgi:hypothetical protein